MRATDALGKIGSAFSFHPDTVARGQEAGLDGFGFSILGRGGALGNVEPEVVHGAFGYSHPALVAKMWTAASERVAPRDAARLDDECAYELGRAALADAEGLDGCGTRCLTAEAGGASMAAALGI